MLSNSNILAAFAPKLSRSQVERKVFGQSLDMLASQAVAMNVLGLTNIPPEDFIAKTRVATNKDGTAKLNNNGEAVRTINKSLRFVAKSNMDSMIAAITEGTNAVFTEHGAECDIQLKLGMKAAEPLIAHDETIYKVAVAARIKAEMEAAEKARAEAKTREDAELAAMAEAEENAKIATAAKLKADQDTATGQSAADSTLEQGVEVKPVSRRAAKKELIAVA